MQDYRIQKIIDKITSGEKGLYMGTGKCSVPYG